MSQSQRSKKVRKAMITIFTLMMILVIAASAVVIYRPETVDEAKVQIYHRDALNAPDLITIDLTTHEADTVNTTEIWVLQIGYDTKAGEVTGIDKYFISEGQYDSVIDPTEFREGGETYGGTIEDTYGALQKASCNMTLYNDLMKSQFTTKKSTTTQQVNFYLIGDEDLSPRTAYLKLTVGTLEHWFKVVFE